MIKLRKARSTDAGKIGAILSEFVDTTDWMPQLHSRAEDVAHAGALIARDWVIVADLEDRVAGFAACDAGDLDALYVARSARGCGVGTALVAHLQSTHPALTLWTFQANEAAQKFYAQHGFAEVARTDGTRNDEKLPDLQLRWEASQ